MPNARAADEAGPAYMQITSEPSDVLFGADYRFRLGRAVAVHEVLPTELLLRWSTEGAPVLADAERERARPADLAR